MDGFHSLVQLNDCWRNLWHWENLIQHLNMNKSHDACVCVCANEMSITSPLKSLGSSFFRCTVILNDKKTDKTIPNKIDVWTEYDMNWNVDSELKWCINSELNWGSIAKTIKNVILDSHWFPIQTVLYSIQCGIRGICIVYTFEWQNSIRDQYTTLTRNQTKNW